MKIKRIKIDDFGCLSGRSFDLSPTFNLVMGDNESGKSTLLAFIKFIFYGLPRKTQENAAERERSLSWSNNTAAGSITFTTDGGNTYTVERRVTRRMGEKRESTSESIRIIDEATGLEVHKGEIPGELFLGVPAPVFESTCFMRQAGVTSINADDLGSALENILMSADESLDLQRSLDRLDGARKLLLHKNGKGGSLYELECDVEDLSFRLSGAKADYARILTKTDEVNERHREALEKRRELDKLEDVYSAITKAATVKRFDALHENENILKEIENEERALTESNSSKDGFLPDADYTASLSSALSAYTSAKSECEKAEKALYAVKAEKEREENREVIKCPLSADEIRSKGGADRICADVEASFAAAEKKKSSGKTFTVGAVALIIVGLAIGALALAIPMMPLLFGGIGCAAVGVAFALIGALSLTSSKKLSEKAEKALSELSPDTDRSVKERISALRRVLLSSFEKEGALRALDSKLAMASSAFELRLADLDGAEKNAEALMNKWKRGDGNISEALEGTISAAREFISLHREVSARLMEAKSRTESLKKELDGINEADLRARVPAAALEAYEKGDENNVIRRRKFCSDALRSMNERAHEAEKELMRLENETENPARLSSMLEETKKKYEAEKLKYDAIILAAEALTEAGENIRSSVSPLLRKSAEEYMATLTGGKYSSMGIGGDYSMTADTRPVDLLSAGTKDSAYISLRLALLDVIFTSERPFLAVDEALAQLDDGRAAAALRLLSSYCEGGGQCILFTCHTREEKLMNGIDTAEKAEIIKL